MELYESLANAFIHEENSTVTQFIDELANFDYDMEHAIHVWLKDTRDDEPPNDDTDLNMYEMYRSMTTREQELLVNHIMVHFTYLICTRGTQK